MTVTYITRVIPEGNHASLAIPEEVLDALGTNRRAPLKIIINGHSYRSTATAVDGQCRVVFPSAERKAAGVSAGEMVTVTLELDSGYREVELNAEFESALDGAGLRKAFDALSYSVRKEYARSIAEAKAEETRHRRIDKAVREIGEK